MRQRRMRRTKDIPIHSTAELDRLEPNAPVTLIVLDEINTPFGDEAFARYSLKKFLDQQGRNPSSSPPCSVPST